MLQLLNQPTAVAETVSPTRLKVSYDLSDKPKPLAVLDTMAMTLEATLRHLAKTE